MIVCKMAIWCGYKKGQKRTFWDSHRVVSDGVYWKDWKDCVVNIQDMEGMMRYEVDTYLE